MACVPLNWMKGGSRISQAIAPGEDAV